MGLFSGVLIATDLDGTLLNKKGEVSLQNRRAIEAFQAEGGQLAMATGRSKTSVTHLLGVVPANAPAILANGGVLFDFDRQKLLHLEVMSAETVGAAFEAEAAFPGVGMEVHLLDANIAVRRNDVLNRHMDIVRSTATDAGSLAGVGGDWVKVLFVDEYELLIQIKAWMDEHYGDRVECVFSNRFLLELQNKGVDKGKGVLLLADLLGIRHEHVYTVGDNQNDLPMLRVAESFAPANATEEVKETVGHLLPHCDENAIAAMIDLLREKYHA